MPITTSVEAGATGAVVVKRATAADAERLRLEGERLRRASHPGVVQFLASESVGGGWELRTAHAGRPVSIPEPRAVARVAAIVAAVASTLADLHVIGLVHGRVDASHVLVGDHGRPVLCGFGDGRGDQAPEDDVAALGGLLGELLGADADPEPIPERRWWGRHAWSGWERRALLLLADQACAEPATRRPTARRLATAITEAVPAVTAGEGQTPVPSRGGQVDLDPIESLRASALVEVGAPSVRPGALALAVLGAALLVAGALRFGGGAVRDEAVPLADVHPTVSTPAPTSTVAPVGTSTTSGPAPRTAEAVTGSVLNRDGRRYRVGQAGDQLLVGDWACDGTATPAVLRPATDEVFVFPRWAEREPLSVAPVLLVPGAAALVSDVAADGCPSLAVRTTSGVLVPVIEAARP